MSDLMNRARQAANERDDGEWGYRVTLEPGDGFEGRWRGQTSREGNYGDQPVYLMFDPNGELCFIYGGRARLDRWIEKLAPSEGDRIAIYRDEDEWAGDKTIHKYGVVTEPCYDALPVPPEPGAGHDRYVPTDQDVPFDAAPAAAAFDTPDDDW
jgi:hypothetical protein